jgi:hypothetical protein
MKTRTKVILAILILFVFDSCKKPKSVEQQVVPISPSELTVTLVSTTQASLNWIDKSTNEAGFKVERKTGNGTFGVIATTSADITTINDAGLTPNTTYTYRVYSFNNTGKSLSYTNEVTITTISLATVTTIPISDTTGVSAVSGGNITSDGGSAITARGVVWGTSPAPTVSLTTKTTDGSGSGQFSSRIEGLSKSTKYYVRAYATNAAGTAYGNELSFTTNGIELHFGLVLYYPFSGNLGDSSGNLRNGVLNGPIFTTDKNNLPNAALEFKGNSWVSIPNIPISGTNSRSISFWVNFSSIASSGVSNTIFSFGSPLRSLAFNLRLQDGKFNLMGYDNDYANLLSSPLTANIWYHVVITYENGVLKYYLGAKQIETFQTNPQLSTSGNFNYLGKSNHLGWEYYFNGYLDDFRVYNRVLSLEEITFLSKK